MTDRLAITPLAVGFVFSLAMHATLVPLAWHEVNHADTDSPNLRVVRIDAPTDAVAGARLTIRYDVLNLGLGRADAAWRDAIYLSTDNRLDAGDAQLASADRPRGLASDDRYTNAVDVTIPPRAAGGRWLIVVADSGQQLTEPTGERDNTRAAPIRILTPPRPDLLPVAIVAPPSAKPGATIPLSLEIINEGDQPATLGWVDRMYLSLDDQLSDDDAMLLQRQRSASLAAGEAYFVGPIEAALPAAYSGMVHLIASADDDDAVLESPNESNNTFAIPLHIDRDASASQTRPRRVEREQRPTPKPDPEPRTRREAPPPEPERYVRLGDDEGIDEPTVAWLPYRDFQELIAPKDDQTEQPAVTPESRPEATGVTPSEPAPAATEAPRQAAVRGVPDAAPAEPQPTPPGREAAEVSDPRPSGAPEADAPQPVADAPPLDQPLAEADRPEPTLDPVDQPESTGPINPDGGAADQMPADSPVTDGQPTRSEASLPPPTETGEDAASALPREMNEAAPLGPIATPDAESPVDDPAAPTAQAAATSDEPMLDDPAKQAAATAPPDATGQPAELDPATSDQPHPDGQPTESDPTPGPITDATDPAESPTEPRESNDPSEQAPPGQPEAAAPAQPSQPSPDAAPQDPRDVTPTRLREFPEQVRPGKVLTQSGIEVIVARPRISVASALTSSPHNPKVRVVFRPDGTVKSAEILRSSGYVNIDSPIRASLYRWRARGERLKELNRSFEIEVTFILSR